MKRSVTPPPFPLPFYKCNLFLCRDSDIALVISYTFHDHSFGEDNSDECEEPAKKKLKLTAPAKRGVLEFSRIKLPAAQFGFYLEQDCKQFVADCLRYA